MLNPRHAVTISLSFSELNVGLTEACQSRCCAVSVLQHDAQRQWTGMA